MKGLALVLTCTVVALAAATGHAQGPGDPGADSSLVRLETALAAAPDDMRAANDYRMAIIAAAGNRSTALYDRAIAFFDKLVKDHPAAANAQLNYGMVYVDKIPAAGSFTQIILASNALGRFTRALELRPNWIGYFTRGASYLFWPKILGRTKYGVADLEEAIKILPTEPKHGYHARTFVALGDGYWMLGDLDKATTTWKAGLAQFPDNPVLTNRLSKQGDELKALIDAMYDLSKRVDTSLHELWTN